jgi:CRP-like cAMP-binding protein
LYDEQMDDVGAGPAPAGIDTGRLGTIPLFAELAPAELALLADRLTAEQFGAGTDILRQGDVGWKLYFLASGQVDVLVTEDGRERRINTLNEGDYFGELALLVAEPRSATVRATVPTVLYSLSQADFVTLLERDTGLRNAVAGTMSARRAAYAEARRAADDG